MDGVVNEVVYEIAIGTKIYVAMGYPSIHSVLFSCSERRQELRGRVCILFPAGITWLRFNLSFVILDIVRICPNVQHRGKERAMFWNR